MKSRAQIGYEGLVDLAYREGFACHGDLSMDREVFRSHVLKVLEKHLGAPPPEAAAARFMGQLHTNDLYLAAACAQRHDQAWKRFYEIYRKCVKDLAASVSPSWDAARELAANILGDLFMPDRSGRPRIASYDGRSSLTSWLRVIVSNHAINERVRKDNTGLDLAIISESAYASGSEAVESAVRANRYQKLVSSALKAACESLTDHERLVLLLRYDEELRVGRVARLLGVHACTVTRQLDRIQEKLRENVVSTLASKHLLNPAEIEECLTDLTENPSHSILAMIKV